MKKILTAFTIICFPALLHAQHDAVSQKTVKYGFKELENKAIPGSPILDQPFLVQGSTGPVKSLGMGWGDPVMFDWNKDGKKDLLIGEFWSGTENTDTIIPFESRTSQIRVYLNIGTSSEPRFSDTFEYAKDKHGKNLSVVTECCIGFTPRFHDLNGDGHIDIITGSFLGHVTCYYGSDEGFESPVNLEQKGFPASGQKKLGRPITDNTGERYWSYSSADFADVDGDGLLDLITGGGALRVSRNIGTKTHPVFDERAALLDVNGDSLVVSDYLQMFFPVGVFSTVPLVTDWDQDGVEDLLITNDYTNSKLPAITFFRGVRQNNILRFEPPVSLFAAEEGEKIFPGSWIRTWVTDWNNDGIADLIVGASVATVNDGEMDDLLSWEWEQGTGIFKSNPGYLFKRNPEKANDEHLYTKSVLRSGIITEEEKDAFNKRVATMVHQGYVYVLLGQGTHN